MNIPPFPAPDLAKLVLGYLAEEQLMTAYDEFLSASPYLDAMRNEYDRIFMTSLKTILAEYRAVKIYVETCKPLGLRRKLFGCTNLLEVVKFLIQNVDVSKVQCADRSRGSISNQNIDKSGTCGVCNTLRLPSCGCKTRLSAQTSSNMEGSSHETSVEATSLEDLPGNQMAVRKRHVKTLPKESRSSHSIANSEININTTDSNSLQNVENTMPDHVHNAPNMTNQIGYENSTVCQLDPAQVNRRSDQLNSVETRSNSGPHHRLSTAVSFHEFTEGVREKENVNSIVPDSSTSENITVQSIKAKESITPGNTNNLILTNKSVTKAHVLRTVGAKGIAQHQSNNRSVEALHGKDHMVNIPDNVRQRSCDQKVTILSDIKVDKTYKTDNSIMPTVLKNATSTPLMQMQTIVINGTQVFKPQPPVLGPNRNFTKDEIMAMPTIIVVPTSSGPQIPTSVKPGFVQANTERTSTVSSSALLEPLVIDVPSSSPDTNSGLPNAPCLGQQKGNESCFLIKTVSVPKDNEASHKNTPEVAPLVKKSSSTPRRTSHVRVLDFATPRRILQESISENTGECEYTPVEVVVSKSPSLHTLADPNCCENIMDNESVKTNKTESSQINSSGSSKENELCPQNQIAQSGKRNWDSDLRVLAVPNSKEALSQVPDSRITAGCRRPPKPYVKKNKLSLGNKVNDVSTEEKSTSNVTKVKPKRTPKSKIAKSNRKPGEINVDSIIVVDDSPSMPVKPTINIITGPDWNSLQELEKEKNLSNKSNSDQTDTPDMDRLSLQNAIGVKLNISDLLETPYKQALYDIQMETPKFLGPDLPGEPLSDIKIMNIPTPRFLNTPKPPGTPYITCPTDYSSGSSYYRPDDQDYMPVDLDYPANLNKDKNTTTQVKVTEEKASEKKTKTPSSKSSRPVRKCAKNVSYVSSPAYVKHKDTEDKLDAASTCSETVSVGSANEINTGKNTAKPVKETKPKTKRSSTSKKVKTPVKKETPRSFMKIKPRRPTPTKERKRGRPRATDSRARKISISKDKICETTSVVVSIPTKSRRKSSTPRKLHCTKTFNSESSGHESPDINRKNKEKEVNKTPTPCPPDSDSEQLPLRWSDDGSQDGKPKEQQSSSTTTAQDTEDISKIKEYIASELQNVTSNTKIADVGSNLHVDLVKRGFDLETAKIIERDLLDTPPHPKENQNANVTTESECKKDEAISEATLESDASTSLKIVQDNEEEEEEEIELSVSECYEQSVNYISYEYDETQEVTQKEKPLTKLKDKFSMEVCIDDGVVVRLRATPFTVMLDQDPVDEKLVENDNTDIEASEDNPKILESEDYVKETEMAVSSISNIEKLYTPMKEAIRAQVYDIFESTLTSLDTPLKTHSPIRKECHTTMTEIVLEVEKIDEKGSEESKRKRVRSEDFTDSPCTSKKPKPDAQSLLNSASNFNFDIESVLYKLHGS